jgi:hypothetical protein
MTAEDRIDQLSRYQVSERQVRPATSAQADEDAQRTGNIDELTVRVETRKSTCNA